jgi:HK97 family phage portal protein
MGIFTSLFSRSSSGGSAPVEKSNDPSVDWFETKAPGDPQILTSRDLANLLQGSVSTAGVGVSPQRAMQFSTVWACVRLLAEIMATVPIHVYVRNRDGSKQRVNDIAASELLTLSPNSWQTVFEYIDFLVTSLCLRGNSYALITRSSGGNIAELIPLDPTRVTPRRSGYDDISYTVRFEKGDAKVFPASEIHHVRGMSLDGFIGVSPITYHRNTIGLAMAAENHGGYLFKNGVMPAGALVHPGQLSDEAYARIKKSWAETHGGEHQGGVAVLEEGLKFEKITMSNADAQYLEVRQFQRSEICSLYRVPPHMIGDLTKSSFSNITQQSLEMVKYTFLPWARRMELAMRRDLLTAKERKSGLYIEFLLDGLERADIEQRYKTYNIGIMSGVLSPNECRAKENLNPRDGGDIYLAPLNMADSTGQNATTKSIAAAVHLPPVRALATKGVLAREQLRQTFAPRFKALADDLVSHETGKLRALIESAGGQVGPEFPSSSADLYRQLPDYIRSQFKGLMREYAVAVRDAALDEIGSDHQPENLSAFVAEVLDSFTTRHIASSEGQLAALINENASEEIAAAIEQRLSEWDATRADKIAEREPVQQESAVALFVWGSAGITKLQWQRRGSHSCPFCKALSGKIVGLGAPFVDAGDFTPEGHEASPLKVRGPKMHAPIHKGCVCIITPVRT